MTDPFDHEEQTRCLLKLGQRQDPFAHGVKTMRSVLEILFAIMLFAAIVTGLKLIEGV
jgi:hypothetical protein